MRSPQAVPSSGGITAALASVWVPLGVDDEWVDMVSILGQFINRPEAFETCISSNFVEGLTLLRDMPDKVVGWATRCSPELPGWSTEELRQVIVSNQAFRVHLYRAVADCLFSIHAVTERHPESCGVPEVLRQRLRKWARMLIEGGQYPAPSATNVTDFQGLEFSLVAAMRLPITNEFTKKTHTFIIPSFEPRAISNSSPTNPELPLALQIIEKALAHHSRNEAVGLVITRSFEDGRMTCVRSTEWEDCS
ncbi:hypothetical protein GNI_111490 [Gregarina niphandrodes]|uniref:Uncharacterized protein n=1 Tax=Gregarina niphandrodes TaxID=110365 RepID=A0A023B3J1_GRENI|nr:hypothetical protein GNI_111490 [Gregarina niphandrodes]EZG55539.1 hypothetical protein GNI_111490 [Gregarina niphandrodes]|eukprot:XP_011131525.1 hypothetical protein GNI_111490 [Gregarina niphandrodes]